MTFAALVTFLDKEKGGRINPPISGYKPHLRVGDEYTSCIIRPKNDQVQVMEFGIEHRVTLELVFHDIYSDRITSDMKVELFEGSKLVGTGVFTDFSGNE